MDEKEKERKRQRNIELDRVWESIGRLDLNPGSQDTAGDLAAGRPVYDFADGLAPGEVIKEYPNGRKEIVRFEGDDPPKEVLVRVLAESGE
jgi:hypothetical protein